MLINSKGSPLLHFSALCDFFERNYFFKNYKFFSKKIFLRFLSLRYGADFRRSRLVLYFSVKESCIPSLKGDLFGPVELMSFLTNCGKDLRFLALLDYFRKKTSRKFILKKLFLRFPVGEKIRVSWASLRVFSGTVNLMKFS